MNRRVPIAVFCMAVLFARFQVAKANLPAQVPATSAQAPASAGPELLVPAAQSSVPANPGSPDQLDSYNIVWNSPANNSEDSMPLGNGDVGLNVWIENNGDLVFYIGKNDAWSGDLSSPTYGSCGLIKVGRVRVSLSPNPFADAATFRQELKLRQGAIEVNAGPADHRSRLLVWVDANRPVIHIDALCAMPVSLTAALESWRKTPTEFLAADTILPNQNKRIAWYYRCPNTDVPELLNRTIGAVIEGDGLASRDSLTLESSAAAAAQHLRVHTLTAQCDTPDLWLARLDRQIAASNAVSLDQAQRDHQTWWQHYWARSWIFITAGPRAHDVTEGYLLQRFTNACSSRGEYPIKFNGSIFTVDHPASHEPAQPARAQAADSVLKTTADYRAWGYQYWFQNTRPMYWPMMISGDFDLMQPLFRMYKKILEGNARQVQEFYGHDGSYFRETAPPWGSLIKITPDTPGRYTTHYYTPVLELSSMMLDYYAYTDDNEFLKNTLLPVADAGVTFFDRHFSRDARGKLLLEPDNAIEMFWKVRNPLPDIAGLHYVLQRLLDLPSNLTAPAARARWQRLLSELPDVPIGKRDGVRRLLPFEEGQSPGHHNSENPELYAIHPFRLYGLGKPDLEMARASFESRKVKAAGCWYQDAVEAALVGDVETAQKDVTIHLTNRDKAQRFPAFWARGHDYMPDEDNGGNGMIALQYMLLQADGDRILLTPSWPMNWDATFKLHAPHQTVVEGTVVGGKLVDWKITPEFRRKDVQVFGEGGNK